MGAILLSYQHPTRLKQVAAQQFVGGVVLGDAEGRHAGDPA